jgi:hypothetical protein
MPYKSARSIAVIMVSRAGRPVMRYLPKPSLVDPRHGQSAHSRRAMPVTARPPVSHPRMCQKTPRLGLPRHDRQ